MPITESIGGCRVHVCCFNADTNAAGTYISRHVPGQPPETVSPIFDTLAELLPWMTANGWTFSEYVNGIFVPWRVVQNTKPQEQET